MKTTIISTLGIASLALFFSACGNAANTTANNSTANAANKSNTAIVVNANQTAVNKSAEPSNVPPNANKTSTPPVSIEKSDAEKIQGELQIGKTESVILYVGAESGDYAAYCFTNDSEAGRAILDKCKDKEQCEVTATTGEGSCKVPGLEADLSASAKILKVESVKSLGSKK